MHRHLKTFINFQDSNWFGASVTLVELKDQQLVMYMNLENLLWLKSNNITKVVLRRIDLLVIKLHCNEPSLRLLPTIVIYLLVYPFIFRVVLSFRH